MYHEQFLTLAAYNSWANGRLYASAAALTPEQFREDRGVYFRSLCGTLNHLLCADRIWLRRMTGTGEAPDRLDAILLDAFELLRAARGGGRTAEGLRRRADGGEISLGRSAIPPSPSRA